MVGKLFGMRTIYTMKVCVLAFFASAALAFPQTVGQGKVFFARDRAVLDTGRTINSAIAQGMVDRLVCASTGKPNVADAWRSLVSPADRVGIKVSTQAGPVGGTHPEIVEAIINGLKQAGVTKIIVWDRNQQDLVDAGFRKNSKSYTLRWVDPRTGYDPKAMLTAPVLGRLIWGDSKFGDLKNARPGDVLSNGDQLSSQSFYSHVLTAEVDKIINVPSLTDSFLTGINGALASITLSNLDNWRRFTKEPAYGNPYVAEIYNDEIIKGKVVFTILDGVFLQYAGGPYPNPNFIIENYMIFAGRDPVAIDATAMRLIEETRLARKLPSIKETSQHIEAASQLGLGEYYEPRIETVPVGGDILR